MKKGFTLIELLVVIAIIGLLSSVVVVSLNSARTKGANAAIQSNLSNIRSQAELDFGDTNYTNVCTDTEVAAMLTAAKNAGGAGAAGAAGDGECVSSSSAWAAWVNFKDANAFCVDSTGAARKVAAQNSGTAALTACPAAI